MAVDSPVPQERRNGLTTALNIIVAPKEALETLREAPMWGWAFLIACVLAIAGSFLSLPAQMHASQASMAHMYATDPRFAQLTDAQKAQQMAFATAIGKASPFFTPFVLLIVGFVSALVLLLVNAIGRGKGTFKQFWASSLNVSIVTFGLYAVINGILALVRGADSYNKPLDQFLAMPSLAWIASGASPKLVAFLAAFNPFTIWGFVLTFLTLTVVARMAKGPAYIGSAILFVLGALFYTLAAR
jgi:hypothetical protein